MYAKFHLNSERVRFSPVFLNPSPRNALDESASIRSKQVFCNALTQ